DTFNGMTAPTSMDKDIEGDDAAQLLHADPERENSRSVWACAPLTVVKRAMNTTSYDERNIVYVEGRVEDTIPAMAPEKIALLRLDTDWYESTYHEMLHLFPRLVTGGVLILDDYGHWLGARGAVDRYMRETKVKLLLNRIDYTGRIAVKLEG